MNVLEKAEKALEHLKTFEGSNKAHEVQGAASTLGRCLGALGSRANHTRLYTNLLHNAIPTLLGLASHESAEVRLVGDEALNRVVVGGFPYVACKSNVLLLSHIDHTKNARWNRAALSRICLGDTWFRPGIGKIRSQAQTLLPKLTQLVAESSNIQLIVEALENNLPRILTALAEYCTDEEIMDLAKALISRVETSEAAVRRGASSCIAYLCKHRTEILPYLMDTAFEKLWPQITENNIILGWFSVIKAVLQLNDISTFEETELFDVVDYLELYNLCILYIEQTTVEHNIQNNVLECLTTLLTQARGEYKEALLTKHPKIIDLDMRKEMKIKNQNRNVGLNVDKRLLISRRRSEDSDGTSDNTISILNTPRSSIGDLTVHTPESNETDLETDDRDTAEREHKEFSRKLQERLEMDLAEKSQRDERCESVDGKYGSFKVNIGAAYDDDVPLKYCARLLASKFLLTGNKGCLISDRSVRVSVKASALTCLSELLLLYPHAVTVYVDKDADVKCHNTSASTDSESTLEKNEFILERNICYQDSITGSLSQDLLKSGNDSKKELNSSQKELNSSQKELNSSLRDVPSHVLDSNMGESCQSGDSTNLNMTVSNFTTNSNMTNSRDPFCDEGTPYPMSSSENCLSSSCDLEMKFDHFADTTTDKIETKIPLKRTDKEIPRNTAPNLEETTEVNFGANIQQFECQHMSDLFVLPVSHSDPQIRGLVRVCVASYLVSVFELSFGKYCGWKCFVGLSKEFAGILSLERLVGIVIKGLSDEIHSCVNNTLQSLSKIASVLLTGNQVNLVTDILNALNVEMTNYYLCKINLCVFYKDFNYEKLFILDPNYFARSYLIIDKLYRLLGDQDQKVRTAAADAISTIVKKIYKTKKDDPLQTFINLSKDQTETFKFEHNTLTLNLVKDLYFYNDLPDPLKKKEGYDKYSLRFMVGDIVARLLGANCKYYAHGLIECLHQICLKWPPWSYKEAFTNQGIFAYCVNSLDYNNLSVQSRILMTDISTMVYPVEIHKLMKQKTTNIDIFERDTQKANWQHLNNADMATLCTKFLIITLRSVNVLVHLVEEVNPGHIVSKALPGSPVRRSSSEAHRKSNTDLSDDKPPRKKQPPITSLKSNLAGNFYSEPFYMKLYDNLRATYSNHKINLDPKSSVFHEFTTSILESLAVQLELSTEKEIGIYTEELLFYLKALMPISADKTVFCVTQLLKCLFGTNMLNQYADYLSILEKIQIPKKTTFYEDILLVNQSVNQFNQTSICESNSRSSMTSNTSSKVVKNPQMVEERNALIIIENFNKNKCDRKWSTNKDELERYIKYMEPAVIQSLKSYTLQNDKQLQCQVLNLLNQLLTLRVNYCMLDSEQIFINFVYKQLDWLEQREIPNGCELVFNIMQFLVLLSAPKRHTKQIIEVPKLIQLCDGLLASGATTECVAALRPVVVKVFGPTVALGATSLRETAAAREVLISITHKCLSQAQVLPIISCLISLSQESSENYYRWSELSCDAILNALAHNTIELDTMTSVGDLSKLLDVIYKDVLLDQKRIEIVLKILFQAPPDQATTPQKEKLRYLTTTMVLLKKYLLQIPESEILLTINYLKSSHISPQSIFFNIKTEIDPLNVQNVNENCANLSPDVVLVRFLFRTLTYALMEVKRYVEVNSSILNLSSEKDKDQNQLMLYCVCVNLLCQVKEMLHLTNNCMFPLTSKTAQTLLHNEQSGLNTGLYSPDENIPIATLNTICLRYSYSLPLLTVHCCHLMIRLKFLDQKYWQSFLGDMDNSPLDTGSTVLMQYDVLQVACFMAYCEHFIENGITDVMHLTWLLVNRVQLLITFCSESVVEQLIVLVHESAAASGLLLQAVAARCHDYIKNEFAVNTWKVLRNCHESQSGALVLLICRILGSMEPAIGVRFANLAIDRCKVLKHLRSTELITIQIPKDELQVALETLQKDRGHIRYSELIKELNGLASTVFDLSPINLAQERTVNPQSILTCEVDNEWLEKQVKFRCCNANKTSMKTEKQYNLALLLSKLTKQSMESVMTCQEFDRKILGSCFKVSADIYIKKLLNEISQYETKEIERESMRKQMANAKPQDQVDSNKMSNMTQSLQVFKKNDSKESKSQFFIPITENVTEKLGNLQLYEEDYEVTPPDLPDLYLSTLTAFDKSLTDIVKLFPKQSRPLSQSENFNLQLQEDKDKYTKRCHEFFADKMFYQEYLVLHFVLTDFLSSFQRILTVFDEIDFEALDKIQETLLPQSLIKNIAIFCVISLQYMSFLIKNQGTVEISTQINDRLPNEMSTNIHLEYIIQLTVNNVSKSLKINQVWKELNVEKNYNRNMSAIGCLFAIVKYFVKDTKPLNLKQYISVQNTNKPDAILTCEKLLTLIEYWEVNFYSRDTWCGRTLMSDGLRKSFESLLVSLARLDIVSNAALIPPIAWSCVDVKCDREQLGKIDLPLQALEDLDVLEAFLFRVNLIGWSSKKHFEEIWVALLAATAGNGQHAAVRGMTLLLQGSVPRDSRGMFVHCPRRYLDVNNGMQLLRTLIVGTEYYDRIFQEVNLERIPIQSDEDYQGYHYGQFNVDFLRMISDITLSAPYKVRCLVRRVRNKQGVDVNSCIQLLMDIASQMLDPKAPTGLAARAALTDSLLTMGDMLTLSTQWARQVTLASTGGDNAHSLLLAHSVARLVLYGDVQDQTQLQLNQRLSKLLSSSFAPYRHIALHSTSKRLTLVQHLASGRHVTDRISIYEQCLHWSLLFSFIEAGRTELIMQAVDFLLGDPTHYCADLVVKGITSIIRQQILPKDLKNAVMEKLLDNSKKYLEQHYIEILLVHLFSADTKLLSPNIPSNVSNMDPDVLMNSMERITLLYKVLRQCKQRQSLCIIQRCIEYFLRETLPPAAILSRVVMEYVQICADVSERMNAMALCDDLWSSLACCSASPVFEVFETAITQNQLPVLSGWIFEALNHLLTNKLTKNVLLSSVIFFLVAASSNPHFRQLYPLCYILITHSFERNKSYLNKYKNYCKMYEDISFSDKKLLCTLALKSKFSEPQLMRLQELCEENNVLNDLLICLNCNEK